MHEKPRNFTPESVVEAKKPSFIRRALGKAALFGSERTSERPEEQAAEENKQERLEAARELGERLYGELTQRELALRQKAMEDGSAILRDEADVSDAEAGVIGMIDTLHAIGELLQDDDTAPFAPGKTRPRNGEITRYLDKKRYTGNIFEPHVRDMSEYSVAISSRDPAKIAVPIALITEAAGFNSWRGRENGRGSKMYPKGGREVKGSSLEAITHYASLETPIPPVEEINIYVQPDGQVFGNNAGGSSHRIAAAFLRGDLDIFAYRLNIVRLETSVVE